MIEKVRTKKAEENQPADNWQIFFLSNLSVYWNLFDFLSLYGTEFNRKD